ncbi:MAG: glycosyltransferase family 39 protein [Bryobacteraceae bacterium]|nr:glycosyltransferase family 39 protein [Bryobacteraceae bacterium]
MTRWSWAVVGIAVAYFVLAGAVLAPYPGMENDEALFAGGIYAPEQMEWYVRLFGKSISVMIMSYIGSLKAWLWAPVFAVWRPSALSLRLPAILAGAGAILLLAALLNRVARRRAAVIGGALLAADSVFLTTIAFDWGPVALQQLLLAAALYMLVRFHQGRRERDLALGFLFLGLALWNKAVFVWILSGLAVAALALLWREIRQLASARRVLIAGGAFVIGALPLLVYNVHRGGATFTGKKYSLADAPRKVHVLLSTMKGDAMAGFLASAGATAADEAKGENLVERGSLWLSDRNGRRIAGLALYALPLALLAGLWSRRTRRAVLFFLIAFLVAWVEMLATVEAGGSAHHTITLWLPLYAILGAGLAAISCQPRLGVALTALAASAVFASNVLVTNEYLARLVRFGPEPLWTDAVFPLAGYIERAGVPQVYVADWGMGDTLRLLFHGKIQLGNAIEPFTRTAMDDEERRHVHERLARTDSLFVAYAEGRKVFPQAEQLVFRLAGEAGYRREMPTVIHDRRGRPVFEAYRFVKAEPPL